jgi:hypothetical protein
VNVKRSDTGTDALVNVAVGALVVVPGAWVPGAVEFVGAPHAASGIVRTAASRARAVRRRNIAHYGVVTDRTGRVRIVITDGGRNWRTVPGQ